MTPAAVHDGRASTVRDARQRVLMPPTPPHPERFVRKPPQPPRAASGGLDQPAEEKSASQDGAGATISTADETGRPES